MDVGAQGRLIAARVTFHTRTISHSRFCVETKRASEMAITSASVLSSIRIHDNRALKVSFLGNKSPSHQRLSLHFPSHMRRSFLSLPFSILAPYGLSITTDGEYANSRVIDINIEITLHYKPPLSGGSLPKEILILGASVIVGRFGRYPSPPLRAFKDLENDPGFLISPWYPKTTPRQ